MAHELHYGSGRGSVHMHGVSHCDVHGQTVRAQQPIIQELAERNKINMNLLLTKRFFLITEFQFSNFFFFYSFYFLYQTCSLLSVCMHERLIPATCSKNDACPNR